LPATAEKKDALQRIANQLVCLDAMSQKSGTPQAQRPPQALRFSHGRGERETRVTGDEPQRIMGRLQIAGEARLARCLLSAFLCAHIFIERETSGYEAAASQ